MVSNKANRDRFQALLHYAPRFAEGGAVMAEWMAQGKLRIDEDVQTGLENAYPAFMRLFTGANTGIGRDQGAEIHHL